MTELAQYGLLVVFAALAGTFLHGFVFYLGITFIGTFVGADREQSAKSMADARRSAIGLCVNLALLWAFMP